MMPWASGETALTLPAWLAEAPAGAKAATLAQLALRWILMFDAVTCAIPGARTPDQARANAAATQLLPLDQRTMDAVRAIYDTRIREHVHGLW